MEKLDEAESELEKALRLGLDKEDYLYNSAMILYKKGNVSEALSVLDDLMISKLQTENFPEKVFNTYIALGDYDNLLKLLDKAVSLIRQKDSYKELEEKCFPFYAFCYYEKNEREKFLEYLRKGIEKAPYIAERLFEKVFPESLDVKDYYAYAEQRMLK